MPPAFLPAPLTPALALRTRPPERSARWRCAAPQYVPLHVHSDFSLLDGASQLPALVARAAELGVPALALTDHGVLYGAIGLVRECGRAGVKPIVGNEMYVVNDHVPVVVEKGVRRRRFHLVVLAKNLVGYRNLVMLTTLSHLEGKVGTGIFARPCVSKLLLERFKEGLIVSSACLGGEVAQSILAGDLEGARNIAMWFRDVFGDDFYLEIQDHGHAEDRIVNPEMLKIAKELDIKIIATNDSHFTSCMDADAHDALICIQTGKLLSDEKRMHYAGNEYFKSVDEMRSAFVDHLPIEDVDVALTNTLAIADKVEKYDLFGETRIPDYPVPEGFDGDHTCYLRHIAKESMRERLAARQAAGLAEAGADHVYMERLEFELEMIDRMGFSSYFLVVWDYIRYARDMLIPVGPGRGSAAGSLVAFALRITDVDPIPFNLLFERFLNPERKSMPDIDTDFSVDGREKIIAYVSQRYGADRVAQIITFNRLTSKAVLKDVARVHNVPYSEADKLAKLIPVVRGKPATLTKLLGDKSPSPEFKSRIEGNEDYLNWIEKARRIEGTNKSYGIHAAGVVISSSPLTDAIPLSRGKHGETITQYPMEDVESLGLLKMDFLGLKNLTVIESALEFINQGRREAGVDGDLDFSVDALPVDDAKTYELLATGELDGIFQLDASAGMRNIVRELKPSSLEDISSILALYRPGPLDAGLIPKFISRKHGLTPIEYDHPLLEPILKETYGIMVYQEQIMRIARNLAGYSLGQADILRRAMGKKKVDDMEREKPRFVSGAVERGVPEQVAINLFEMMIGFAEYCFNKSHSTAYAYLTYQTAYLKANYPVEYSAALLRANMNQSDKLVRYLADANISGVRVMPPSVNRSSLGFTVDRSGDDGPVVLFGLEAVKAVGSSISEAIIEEREARGPYTGIMELVERISSRVLNKRSMAALILSGAFDEFHPNRKVLHEQLDSLLNLRRKLRDRRKRREKKEMSEEDEQKALEKDRVEWENIELELAHESQSQPDFPLLERLAAEKQTLGFYASGHPLYDLHNYTRFLGCMRVDDIVGITSDAIGASEPSESVGASGVPDGSEVMIVSCVADFKQLTTARGKKMAKWMIEDACSRVSAIVFPSTYPVIEQRRVTNADYFSQARSQINATDVELESPIVSTQKDACRSELSNSSLIEVLSKDVTTAVEEERKELVVSNDARVVVWGKVDRESSGAAQIIVDDVQRIEDVRAVVATARFHPQRTHGVHQTILLDVSLTDTGEYTYTNKQGESVKRRKRSWSTDLTSKARVPLVLRELGQDGSVLAYTNAGNNLRFTANERMEDLIKALEHDTGFEVELLSVADAAYHRGPEEEAAVTSDPEEAGRFDFKRRNYSGSTASRNESIRSRALLSTGGG